MRLPRKLRGYRVGYTRLPRDLYAVTACLIRCTDAHVHPHERQTSPSPDSIMESINDNHNFKESSVQPQVKEHKITKRKIKQNNEMQWITIMHKHIHICLLLCARGSQPNSIVSMHNSGGADYMERITHHFANNEYVPRKFLRGMCITFG